MTKTKNGYKISFLIVLITVVLSFCICVGSVVAWLRVDYIRRSDSLELGTVKLALYNGSTEVKGTTVTNGEVTSTYATVTIPASSGNIRTLGIKVRNMGTIDCLVRARFNIYYYENDGNRSTILLSETAKTIETTDMNGHSKFVNYASIDNSGWILRLPGLPQNPEVPATYTTAAFGELFYNNKISPYIHTVIDDGGNISSETVDNNAKTIISSITTVDSEKDRTLYIDITVDAISYSGNIYRKTENPSFTQVDVPVEAYPFGSKDKLPSNWTAWK